ncbi:MAG: hypothetical protein K6F99_09595 [Lachnospiraceae bacterium]|nr:hypothetical protein [Lachnospiraceae bacterium]
MNKIIRKLMVLILSIILAVGQAQPAYADFAVGTLRGSENFDRDLRKQSPWFYKTGEYTMQGINQYGYTGTCGQAALASAMNHLFSTSYYTENMIVKMTVDHGWCTLDDPVKENLGGMSPAQMMYVLNILNNVGANELLKYPINMDHIAENVFKEPVFQNGGFYVNDNSLELDEDDVAGIDADIMITKGVPDVDAMADDIDNGYIYLECVDSNILWDYDRAIVEQVGMKYIVSNHWITVSNTIRDSKGNLLGFYIIDSGTGTKTVLRDKMHKMIFGLPDEPITDAACVRVRPLKHDD